MRRAVLHIKALPHYRREAFEQGVRANGFVLVEHVHSPEPDDVLVIWNRFGHSARVADLYESRGARVLVAENGYLGIEFGGRRWYAIAKGRHNSLGTVPVDATRLRRLDIDLQPWRTDGDYVLVLPQRGIGEPGVAMPAQWTGRMEGALQSRRLRFRVRHHPGLRPALALEKDLDGVRSVMTWGSGAAIKAMALGVPVFHGYDAWIAAAGSRPISAITAGEKRDDAGRHDAFCHIASAMWTVEEIASGEAIACLL